MPDLTPDETTKLNRIEFTAQIVTAMATAGQVRPEGVELAILNTHAALLAIDKHDAAQTEPVTDTATHEPATTVRKSLASPDHIISMIDGKPYKTLRRHLSTHGLTPAEYRARYGLKDDYPMTAPAYATMRSEMAKKIGLGRKPAA